MSAPALTRADFGADPNGIPVERWTLRSLSGVEAEVLTYGAVLHALRVPGRSRADHDNVVLALPDVKHYAAHDSYFGAVVGRYANRIAGGTFSLEGIEYRIPVNDRGHALHGGPEGFDRRVWSATPLRRVDGAVAVRMSLFSPDGDQGFPGALAANVTYALHPDGTLAFEYSALTSKPTVVNLTQHAYFNLSGDPGRGVLDHLLTVDADAFLPVSAGIPLRDAPVSVAGTPFDFTKPRPIGERIAELDPQLVEAGGYDHCWALHRARFAPALLRRAARLEDLASGRVMEVRTTEPGMQVYSGNHLDGSAQDALGRPLRRFAGVCLETQHFPDSPNRPDHPSTVLRPGMVWRSHTELTFPHLHRDAGPTGSDL